MVTVDTEGTEKDVVSFGLFSEQWQVTIVWTGGSVGESFLRLLDKWNVDIKPAHYGLTGRSQGDIRTGGHWNKVRVQNGL